MVFCNEEIKNLTNLLEIVTILILIDGFLQYVYNQSIFKNKRSHNPYFNRWFSAISINFEDFEAKKESQSLF